ncbi:MAG: aspartate--ammonia ligase [Crocinitomicaceae bacterium]|nr:aspartate--ammonia ligase [Crocinitomicaceae bacterium]
MKTTLKHRSLAFESLLNDTKQTFESELKEHLNLVKINAPLFVAKNSGLNDDLNGVENAVSFKLGVETNEIVHSLAKWKRWYLGELSVLPGQGIVTDMKAIRIDEDISPIHSYSVDQWDWEKVINPSDRTIETLISHGVQVFDALKYTERKIALRRGEFPVLPNEIKILHTEDVMKQYPELSPKEREHAIAELYGAVLLIGIGGVLSSGEVHDLRAPDYDDWSTKDDLGRPGLNADLIVWDSVRELSLEISSMGIRVDKDALEAQLEILDKEDRKSLPFHKALLNGELPSTIGGGIGQSRVAMFVNKKEDIKEVQPLII